MEIFFLENSIEAIFFSGRIAEETGKEGSRARVHGGIGIDGGSGREHLR